MMRFTILAFDNYDGDSFNLTLDLGFGLHLHRQCRLEGADTPELRDRRPDWKAAAYLARDQVRAWVAQAGEAVFVSETYTGKFGRPLGDIEIDGKSVRERLIAEHLAVPYAGQAKADIAAEHQRNIDILKTAGAI